MATTYLIQIFFHKFLTPSKFLEEMFEIHNLLKSLYNHFYNSMRELNGNVVVLDNIIFVAFCII